MLLFSLLSSLFSLLFFSLLFFSLSLLSSLF